MPLKLRKKAVIEAEKQEQSQREIKEQRKQDRKAKRKQDVAGMTFQQFKTLSQNEKDKILFALIKEVLDPDSDEE